MYVCMYIQNYVLVYCVITLKLNVNLYKSCTIQRPRVCRLIIMYACIVCNLQRLFYTVVQMYVTSILQLCHMRTHQICTLKIIQLQFIYFFCIVSPCTLERDLGVVGDCIDQLAQSISGSCCPHGQSRVA